VALEKKAYEAGARKNEGWFSNPKRGDTPNTATGQELGGDIPLNKMGCGKALRSYGKAGEKTFSRGVLERSLPLNKKEACRKGKKAIFLSERGD